MKFYAKVFYATHIIELLIAFAMVSTGQLLWTVFTGFMLADSTLCFACAILLENRKRK